MVVIREIFKDQSKCDLRSQGTSGIFFVTRLHSIWSGSSGAAPSGGRRRRYRQGGRLGIRGARAPIAQSSWRRRAGVGSTGRPELRGFGRAIGGRRQPSCHLRLTEDSLARLVVKNKSEATV